MQVSRRLQVCYLGVIEAINASQLDLDQWQRARIARHRVPGCQFHNRTSTSGVGRVRPVAHRETQREAGTPML